MSISFGWRTMLAIAGIWAAAGCTQRNPDLCCDSEPECTAIGFSSRQPCDLGVCVHNECTTAAGTCDDDLDCGGATPFCAAGTCAVCSTSASCPTSAPACDAVSHDCRACVKDSECDSGACNLAAGTCVDPGQILYASPSGTISDLCTQSQPCAIAKAATSVGETRPYLVLSSGTYTSGPFFDDQRAVVCGHDATIASVGSFAIENGSAISVRDLKILQAPAGVMSQAITPRGTSAAISFDQSELVLDNVEIRTISNPNFLAVRGIGRIEIHNSKFTHGLLDLAGQSTIDRSTFNDGATLTFASATGSQDNSITNSVFMSTAEQGGLTIYTAVTGAREVLILNNTFSGGSIMCNGATNQISFRSNIFSNTTGLAPHELCKYQYNLITPNVAVDGDHNITGDPLFASPLDGDFHLRPGSPAIDAGNPLTPVEFGADREGVHRPQGANFDIGAFEYPQ